MRVSITAASISVGNSGTGEIVAVQTVIVVTGSPVIVPGPKITPPQAFARVPELAMLPLFVIVRELVIEALEVLLM